MCEIDDGHAIYIGFNPCDVSIDKSKLKVLKYFIVNTENKKNSCNDTKKVKFGKIRIRKRK